MANATKVTDSKRAQFLEVLSTTANATRAALVTGISRQEWYRERRENPTFAKAWDEANEIGTEALEDEAIRRASEGADKPLTHQGQFTYLRDFDAIDPDTGERYPPHMAPVLKDDQGRPMVATVKEYSDTLLIFMLKARKPEKYRDRADINVTGKITLEDLIVGGSGDGSK